LLRRKFVTFVGREGAEKSEWVALRMLSVMDSVFVLAAIMRNQDEGDKNVSGDLPSVVSTREFGSLVAIPDRWV
jgi:hypothetical protein